MATVQGMLFIPILNPIRFHSVSQGNFWEDEIPSMEYQQPDVRYCQKYEVGDIFYLQFLAAFNMVGVAIVTLVDNDDVTKDTYNVVVNPTRPTLGDLNAFEIKDTIASLDEGVYFVKIVIPFFDGGIILYSEPIHIAATHTDTIMISYRHDFTIQDCIFGGVNLPTFYLRVEGGLKSDGFAPAGKFTQYTDLDFRPVMLQSQPYNLYTWLFGGSLGIPNHMADRINRAFSLDQTLIDNILYMRNEGAKMERNGDNFDPRAGWSLELLKNNNDYSEHWSGDSNIIHKAGVWIDGATVDDKKIFSTDATP